jgi:hypothetical protein
MGSGPEYFRLGRRELIVCERALGVQLCEVFDLVGRVRRRGRILRLVLAVGHADNRFCRPFFARERPHPADGAGGNQVP